MAFGALGRARAATTAKSTEPSAGSTISSDASGGFAATQADEETKSSEIPDPATFAASTNENPTTVAGAESEVDREKEPAPAAAASAPDTDPAKDTTAKPVSAAQAPADAAAPASSNPLLVAGVPLAAAVVLMGIYWLILRAAAL
jgi:hypothetical protein